MTAEVQTAPHVDPREIDAEMIRTLYHRVVPLVFANFGALILLTGALWSSTDRGHLILWAGALGTWTMARFVLAHVYMRRERSLEETRRWTLAFAIGSTMAGCLWGSSTLLIDDLARDDAGLVTAFIMAALSAAAIAGYTNSLLAFAGFVVPSLLPYGLRLIHLDGEANLSIAAFVVFWGALLAVMARHQNAGFREAIALVLRNRKLAERLALERDRAEAANLAKTRFLGNMSHELRTPLNAIVGYADMMRNGVLGPIGNDRYAAYAHDIFRSGRHLSKVFDQILEVSRLETGTGAIDNAEVDLSALVRAAADDRQADISACRLSLRLVTGDDTAILLGDPAGLAMMVENLLDNAIRFTPVDGDIVICIETDVQAGHRLSIADTGIGMEPEWLRQVLIPFALMENQEHLQRADDPDGPGGHTHVGLGLPLVNLLARAHAAELTLESQPGKGTTATLRFPPDRSFVGKERLTA